MTSTEEREALLAEVYGQNRATIGNVLGTGSIEKATEPSGAGTWTRYMYGLGFDARSTR